MISLCKSKASAISVIGATLVALTLSTTAAMAATLSTGLTQNNGQRGIMFNVSTGANALVLESLQTDFYSGTADYEIYYTVGDFTAVENTPSAWTLLDTLSGFIGTSGLQSWDFVDLLMPANETIGLYVTNTSGGGINYADGTVVGSTLATDGALTIFGGVGRSYPFGVTFTPRDFVGSLDYSIAAVPLPAGGLLILSALGGIAALKRRKKHVA